MKKRRRFGDRKEGRRIRTMPPMSMVIPYIMKERNDACNLVRESIDITETEKFIRKKKEGGYKDLSLLHVIIAAYVRTLTTRPGINRFVAGQRVYSRNSIIVNMAVKKEMTLESPDTMIKVEFDINDTVNDVYNKFNKVAKDAIASDETEFDNTAKILTYIPGLLLRFSIGFLKFLDYFDKLPKSLLNVSPFHGSMIITSMGSLGIPPIYHHLYNFGNLPLFIAYGAKYHKNMMDETGNMVRRTFVDMCAVTDERICDGFYYASAMKLIVKNIRSPEILDRPPEIVVSDID